MNRGFNPEFFFVKIEIRMIPCNYYAFSGYGTKQIRKLNYFNPAEVPD